MSDCLGGGDVGLRHGTLPSYKRRDSLENREAAVLARTFSSEENNHDRME